MESRIAEALGMELEPVAVLFADERPDGVKQFAPGRWGCVMWLLASAAKGRPAVADRETFGCYGGGVGLGFGNRYEDWPGGIDCFYRFLSTGNAGSVEGRKVADRVRPYFRARSFGSFLHGEAYAKTPELAESFVAELPMTDVPTRYVVFNPLRLVAEGERVEVVVFLVDADRLSAMVVLANYGREGNENVIIPSGAGCQTVGIVPYREARSEHPRAVVGLTDISARIYIARQVGRGLMSFAIPYRLWREMEEDVPGSFLERDAWRELRASSGS